MLMRNFLKDRKSIREYKNKSVDLDILNELVKYAEHLKQSIGNGYFRFVLFEDGETVYNTLKGKGGYSGVMIESPHYIGLEIINQSPENIIKAAYSMESMVTKAIKNNLGTCWVSIVDVDEETKKDIYPDLKGNMDYLLAIGKPVPKNPFSEDDSSARLRVEEIVFDEEIGKPIDYEKLETRGLDDLFYYVRFAPSSYNSQPSRFILKKDKIVLVLKNSDGNLNLIDAGIMIYYLKQMFKANGLSVEWKLLNQDVEEIEENKYTYIAEFNI